MSTLDLLILVIHVLCAAIWTGAAFFAAWFMMPALKETGPDGGKVMAAIQRRGWIVVLPIVATITVLTGFWLYRPWMGMPGTGPRVLGLGGVIGVIALGLGAGVVSRSLNAANGLTAKAMSAGEGPERGRHLAAAATLRERAMTFARIVSILLIVTLVLMVSAFRM